MLLPNFNHYATLWNVKTFVWCAFILHYNKATTIVWKKLILHNRITGVVPIFDSLPNYYYPLVEIATWLPNPNPTPNPNPSPTPNPKPMGGNSALHRMSFTFFHSENERAQRLIALRLQCDYISRGALGLGYWVLVLNDRSITLLIIEVSVLHVWCY